MTAPRGTEAEQQTAEDASGPPRTDAGTSVRATGAATARDGSLHGHDDGSATTVLPGGSTGTSDRRAPAAGRPPAPARSGPRQPSRVDLRPSAGGRSALVGKARRARLSLRRLDPWSVFLFSLVASVFVGIALVVAVAVLFFALTTLGVVGSLNELFAEVTGGTGSDLLTANRVVGGAAVLAAVNVVFLTLLATLGALLYNLCASFTGGIELTLGERD